MFFTQEDYRKIEKWLLSNSIKDTEFVEASTPLQGNETLAFVQKGKNVKVPLKDLIDQIFLLGVSDFLNISDKYKENYISLSQAIKLIPYRSRKIGQVITFLDEFSEWRVYQFQGEKVNQWNNTTLWIDLLQAISDSSNIVPDEEDITGVLQGGRNLLKFKDKNYNKDDYSGLGRVFLRKNLTTVTDPSTESRISTNLLTQEMLGKENTIYIVQYDYSLNGNTVVVPEGSILDFQGGNINNGTLSFKNNTKIRGHFLGDATIEGNPYYIDYIPDEEDITIVKDVVKFKDKEYNTSEFSGLGRVYLRKNISNGKNILTQNMVNKPNTRYIIQYDYDLNNQTISIPKGCIFDFQGGSLKNGTISTTDLDIISSHRTIFFDIEIQGTLNHNLHFVDIWSNKPFLRIFTAISNLVITKDWTLEHTTDWVYHNFRDNPVYIYGNYHTITFDTNNQNSKTTFINSNKVYIENLNIKIEDTSTQEKIATLIDCAQCTLINVYFYGYNRLVSNWSRVDINEDTKLYVSNCRLYTTSFIFEHIFSEVEIYDSTIEVLRDIRSNYQSKIISCSAYRDDNKSKVIIRNCNIIGEWELVYNGDTDFRNGDKYNYKQFDIYNCNLKLFNITYDDSRLIKSSLVANYYNCHITKYMGCNLLNGIKEINHYNCNFIYSPDINIYTIMPFSIISCDTITFFDCNFTLNSNDMPVISFRDSSMSNTDATYNFTFVNCNINSTTIVNSNFFLINSLSNTNIDEEDVKNFVNICDIKLNYKGDKPQCSLIIRTSTKQYLVPCSNLKLNTYSVTETAFDTMLLENGTDIYLNDRVSTCYKNGVYTKGIITCGPTENRPTYYTRDYEVGFQYFDTTLGKPIWWNNGKWVDATGATV